MIYLQFLYTPDFKVIFQMNHLLVKFYNSRSRNGTLAHSAAQLAL